MEEDERFPYRFFVVAFAWSWLIWLPLVLAGAGIIPLEKDLLSAVTVPWIMVGVFGPGVGALYSL
ncbi:MAG: CPBP family intramembrane glutamate endopeptidase, partial [Coriobacteriia bacterium]|nr:CPBP family intramembrane glutamate endopeptidase [Coriobacteriia bacterium]